MSLFLLTYDLRQPGQDYDKLTDAIKALDSNHIMQSVWLIKTDMERTDLFNRLHGLITKNDEMALVEIKGQPSAALDSDKYEWLKKRM